MASNTSCLGASNRRVRRISSSDGVLTLNVSLFTALLPTMARLLSLHLLQVRVQTIEAVFPDLPVLLGPRGDLPQGRGLDPAPPPLRVLPARDQPRVLEHAQVLRHRG